MRRGINPLAVVVMTLIAIAAFVVAFLVKGHLPENLYNFRGLIFWGIVIVLGGGGALFSGKFFNREDR